MRSLEGEWFRRVGDTDVPALMDARGVPGVVLRFPGDILASRFRRRPGERLVAESRMLLLGLSAGMTVNSFGVTGALLLFANLGRFSAMLAVPNAEDFLTVADFGVERGVVLGVTRSDAALLTLSEAAPLGRPETGIYFFQPFSCPRCTKRAVQFQIKF